jgi:hypothetical protein
MSVAAMTAAWSVDCEPSQKLILLALADHANDETWKAWPSLGHLSKKTGLNRRTVSRCIEQLLEKKLIGRINRGQESTVYQLNVASWGHDAPRGDKPLGAQSHKDKGDKPLGVGASCPKGRGDTPHEPSGNRQIEPSGNQGETPREKIPYSEIVKAYHQALPSLAGIRKLTPARKAAIAARWREDMPSLDDWRDYFRQVGECPFLLGDNDRGWRADLEWLTKQSSYAKVIEGKYQTTKQQPKGKNSLDDASPV